MFRGVRQGLSVVGLSGVADAGRPAYLRLLGLVYPRGVPRYIHGEDALYFCPEARSVPEDLDRASFLAMKDRVRDGAIVLDLGANVGMYTLLMARWAGSGGKVFAFEPSACIARMLQRNSRLNRLANRVEVIPAAVGDSVGQVAFFTAGASGHASVVASAAVGEQAEVVPLTTVDAFCRSRRVAPTFLKIDVEGCEAHVLEGARDTIQQHLPDLLIETHPQLWVKLGITREKVANQLAGLESLGYSVKSIEGVEDPLATEAHLMCCAGQGSR
jgi:FkbM family methyltransferase